MKPKRDFALEVFFAKWEFAARYNIGGSDIQSMALSDLLSLADPEDKQRWDSLYLGYTETNGAETLRQAISATYDRITPQDLLCFAGAEEAIFCAMHALLGPADHALVTYPNYQSAETLPLGICETTGIRLDPEHNWTIDIDAVRDSIRPNTKLMYVNFPNNPTGKILEADKYEALVALCRRHGIYLLSDEVYRPIERDPALRLPQAADMYERALSLNVMSKAFGMAGLRIGWMACQDRTVLRQMERIKLYLTICNSAPSELLATIALKASDTILDRNRRLVAENRRLLGEFFGHYPHLFDWYEPDGGCIAFIRYHGDEGVEVFAQRLVEESGVLLLPASLFRSDLGEAPTDRFRVGFGRTHLPQALAGMGEFLDRS